METQVLFAGSALERAQIHDLRRSVFCGELHWPREVVEDAADADALLALLLLGPKPVATARLVRREALWHVELLAVLDRFRSLGLGRRLMEAVEARALEEGASSLHALPGQDVKGYFEKLGYHAPSAGGPVLEKSIKLNYGGPNPKAL